MQIIKGKIWAFVGRYALRYRSFLRNAFIKNYSVKSLFYFPMTIFICSYTTYKSQFFQFAEIYPYSLSCFS